MSEGVVMELVEKVINDAGFREEALMNLDACLDKYGYTQRLSKEELEAVKQFYSRNKTLSPNELNENIKKALGKQGLFI